MVVCGDWLPRQTLGRLQVLWAMARNVYTALWVLLSHPPGTFDVVVADQISICVPVLLLHAPVLSSSSSSFVFLSIVIFIVCVPLLLLLGDGDGFWLLVMAAGDSDGDGCW